VRQHLPPPLKPAHPAGFVVLEHPMAEASTTAKAVARKRGPSKCSSSTISLELRVAGLSSFKMLGGIKYLMRVAKTNPAAYLAFMSKLIKNEDGGDAQGLNIYVQQISIGAVPIPGVLNSPVVEHIAPQLQLVQRLVANDDG
jgi:hypothetical protein